jgi:serine/threonine-protein kinase
MELIGRRFGHIRVTEVVGQGGMGDVYGGFDETLERKVALKVLNADQRLDDEARERLLREARALSKLEHPNICRIHDYIESDQVDLLVLEYIDGTTLFDTPNGTMSRSEKLRIAIAIAEVLITAHRGGILHRDLKPENVMLTKTGEVKVLDFGLARWLHGTRKSSGRQASAHLQVVRGAPGAVVAGETVALSVPRAVPGSGRREAARTPVGITLGTPLYMSPEQARGETLTSASDMFSFGLLLQWLFTGKDPHPIDVTAREAILRVARGDTLPVEGAPKDITALINRLKQLAAADRPTAIETLERLQYLDNKPQRIARRGIAAAVALVLLVGGWRYTVDLKTERAIAISKTEEAQKRRAEVEDLLEFMLGDLRKKLEPVGKLDVLDDVAQRALAYTDSIQPDQLSSNELLRSAKALHQLAQVRIAQGQLDGALFAATRASHFTDVAARKDPKSLPVQFGVATSHFWIANVHRFRGELPEALKHAEIYRDVTARLAASEPSNRDYQVERDYGESAVATILEQQGNFVRAAEVYEASVRERRARMAANPTSASDRAELAVVLNKLGYARQCLGDLAAARRDFEEEFEIDSALIAIDPTQHKWRERLSISHDFLAALLEMLGEDDNALNHRMAELAIGRELHAHDPSNAAWQRNLAIAQMRFGDLLRRRGDRTALSAIREADALLGDLLTRKDARKSWRKDFAVVHIAEARALLADGQIARALNLARQADQDLSAFPPIDPLTRRLQADAAITLGEALLRAADRDGARLQWTRAQTILAPDAASSSDPLLLDAWSHTLMRLGRDAEADHVLARLDLFGYHSRDLDLLRLARRG